jgi:ABC-type amino acid transport substrate-binding protein
MLKRHWPWLLGLLVLVIMVGSVLLESGGLGGFWAEDESWARIQNTGLLRVGMDASYPPFEVVDDTGQFTGLDVDLARMLAQRWGVGVQFASVHFDGLYDALKTERFDLIISALPYDRTMTRDVLYSHSYFNAGQVLVARRDDPRWPGQEDLDGLTVAVELGAEAHQLARQLARDQGWQVEVLPQREPDAVAAQVTEGRADLLICDRVTAYGLTKQHAELAIVGEPLTDEPYVIAARPGATTLMAEVNAALTDWRNDGTLEALQTRWLGGAER